jgi:hypothetical protein
MNTINTEVKDATASTPSRFVCERCGHDAKTKQNLVTHLRKQKVCETSFSKRQREVIIAELTTPPEREKRFECEFCKKKYSSSVGKCKHKKICPFRPEVVIQTMAKELAEVKAKLNILETKAVGASNINTQNNYINTLNIHINNFGNESTIHLTNDFLNHCLLNPSKGLTSLIEKIHYNEELPENHNIRHKSTKQNLMQRFIDNIWHDCDASNTLDELIKKGYRILSTYYSKHVANNPQIVEDEMRSRIYERFRFLCDKKSVEYCAVKRDLRVLVKDKTMYLLAPSDAQINQDEIMEIEKELVDEIDTELL